MKQVFAVSKLHHRAQHIAHQLEWFEERTKPLFVAAALMLYAASLVDLAADINPLTDLNPFLVEALAKLSIPFGVILLQELFELVANISHSTLKSAQRQFEIVVLVIVRSFFKNFAYVNTKVEDGVFGEPVQEAVIKVIAIVVMITLIIYFRRLTEHHTIQNYADEGRTVNLYKQMVIAGLIVMGLVNVLIIEQSFESIEFLSLVFTELIVVDAIFLILAILRDSEFDSLILESGLVISLIFARFPLFTSNILAYSLSMLGMAFATASLFLFHKSRQTALPAAVDAQE